MIPTLVRAAAVFVGEPTPTGRLRAELSRRLVEMIGRRPPGERRLLRAGVLLLEAAPIFRYGRRFSRLDDARAEETLAFFADAPLRPLRRLHAALRPLLQFAWYLDPEVQAAIGYDGPWLGRVAVEAAAPPDLSGAPRDASGGAT